MGRKPIVFQILKQAEKDQRIEMITSETRLKVFLVTIWKQKDVDCHKLLVPNTLYSIGIRVSSHFIDEVMRFLKKHSRLDLFNSACLPCTDYPNFRKPTNIFLAIKK